MTEITPTTAEGPADVDPSVATPANRGEFTWEFDGDGLVAVPEDVARDVEQLRRQAAAIRKLAQLPRLSDMAKLVAGAAVLRETRPLTEDVLEGIVELAVAASAIGQESGREAGGYVWRSEVLALIQDMPGRRLEDNREERPAKSKLPFAPGPWG